MPLKLATTQTIDGRTVAATVGAAVAPGVADLLVVAAGVSGPVGAEHVAPGTAIIDVGMHRAATGLVGDVRTEAVVGTASHVTPVPGGVGPMTGAMLVENTLEAARWAGTTL